MAQTVKNPAMRETWVQSLGWEDPFEKEKATTPVSWPEEFHGLYSPWGRKESDMIERLSLSLTPSLNVSKVKSSFLRKIIPSLCPLPCSFQQRSISFRVEDHPIPSIGPCFPVLVATLSFPSSFS